MLDPAYASFVGLHPLPVRHGLTIGELARLFKEERSLASISRSCACGAGGGRWPSRRPGCPGCSPRPTCRPWTRPSSTRAAACRRHEPLRGARHHAALRARGRALARPLGCARSHRRGEAAGRLLPTRLLRPDLPETRGAPLRRRAAARDGPSALLRLAHLSPADRPRARPGPSAGSTRRDPPYEYEHIKRPIDILFGADRIRVALESGSRRRSSRRGGRRNWPRSRSAGRGSCCAAATSPSAHDAARAFPRPRVVVAQEVFMSRLPSTGRTRPGDRADASAHHQRQFRRDRPAAAFGFRAPRAW